MGIESFNLVPSDDPSHQEKQPPPKVVEDEPVDVWKEKLQAKKQQELDEIHAVLGEERFTTSQLKEAREAKVQKEQQDQKDAWKQIQNRKKEKKARELQEAKDEWKEIMARKKKKRGQ